MYNAIVCSIVTSPIPGADRIKLGQAAGYQVIVGSNVEDGQLGILLPDGGCVTEAFGVANGLFKKHPTTGEAMGGYLDANGRIRTLKLRKQISNALWLPLSSLVNFKPCTEEAELATLVDGQELRQWRGEVFCDKYYTPATQRAMALAKTPKDKLRALAEVALPRHYDTAQLRHCWRSLPEGPIVVTEKLHGTSGRTGNVGVEQPLNWFFRLLNKVLPEQLCIQPKIKHTLVSGTRNCLVKAGATGEKGMEYRCDIHDALSLCGLQKDEVLYYEIVGFTSTGTPIMSRHKVDQIGDPKLEKSLRQLYGDTITYAYGCDPESDWNKYAVYVYRITQGGVDLTYTQMCNRVTQLNIAALGWPAGTGEDYPEVFPLKCVPLLARLDSGSDIMARCEELSQEQSALTLDNPREGVCVRVETDDTVLSRHHKYKGFVFCALEGIAANNPDYVDEEDAQ